MLGAFAFSLAVMLAYCDYGEKSNEIPAVQAFIGELGLPLGNLRGGRHQP